MTGAPTTFDPRRFQTTVPFYARYRLGYPDELIARIVQICGAMRGDLALDLGCGPGLVAIPFARAGMKVTAVDPEPDMIAAATEAAREAGVALDVRRGSSFDLPPGIGPFKLVTMGRSFHWMDREATLKVLDKLIVPEGSIVLLHDNHPRTAENRWRKVLNDLGNEYGRRESRHVMEYSSTDYRTHESFLLRSPFNRLQSVGIFVERTLTADDIVGLAFSLSTSAPQKLGDRKDAFERDLRAALAALSPDGQFTEIAEAHALIARRS
ncbi:MAG: methyltransferase domain-containing protein [Rhizomicrobium sp.]